MYSMDYMNVDSEANQEIKRGFVQRELLCDVSLMVEFILAQNSSEAPFCWDDVENQYIQECMACGEEMTLEEVKNEDGDTVYRCPICGAEFSNEDCVNDRLREPLEWYEITESFYRSLLSHGEAVINYGGGFLWGRCCSGQAVFLDGVISEICLELGILKKAGVA